MNKKNLRIVNKDELIDYIEGTKQKLPNQPVTELKQIEESILQQNEESKSYKPIEVECVEGWEKFHQFKVLFYNANSLYVQYLGTFKY